MVGVELRKWVRWANAKSCGPLPYTQRYNTIRLLGLYLLTMLELVVWAL